MSWFEAAAALRPCGPAVGTGQGATPGAAAVPGDAVFTHQPLDALAIHQAMAQFGVDDGDLVEQGEVFRLARGTGLFSRLLALLRGAGHAEDGAQQNDGEMGLLRTDEPA
ncbi:hypothetical protein [Streptomyces sp. NPDC056949]|uniref:hypothetical protein n=1 Tax=Streptomyces sp. NPDC056949 TaxID=3345976 RepID=UPI0036336DA6